jgi:hypothetical protein
VPVNGFIATFWQQPANFTVDSLVSQIRAGHGKQNPKRYVQ